MAENADGTRLGPWSSGGILLTYWCNAACDICYEKCNPRKRGKLMEAREARFYFSELKKLGCRGSAFHLAGGEPFRSFPRLLDIITAARDVGMTPTQFIETNGYWCISDEKGAQMITQLKEADAGGLMFSADIYHQQFVPIENVQRGVRLAREILGADMVTVRYENFLNDPIDPRSLTPGEIDEIKKKTVQNSPERMTGCAGEKLSQYLPKKPLGELKKENCDGHIRSGHIHLDPYGNVFPAGCSGVVIGNGLKTPLERLNREMDLSEHPTLLILAKQGPFGLYREAARAGYEPKEEGYVDKCHLCHDVRRFLWKRGCDPVHLGPDEFYMD